MSLPHTRYRGLAWLLLGVAGTVTCSDDSAIGPGKVVTVRIVPDNVTLDVGQAVKTKAFPLDQHGALLASKRATWASDDPAIATVDDTGGVTAAALGQTTIHATAAGVTGDLAVTVSPPDLAFGVDTARFGTMQLAPSPTPLAVPVTTKRLLQLTGVTVDNITYGASASGWLQATLDQTTTPATLTLTATTTTPGFPAGTFLAKVVLSATNPGTPPATLDVLLTVGVGPTISLTPGSLDFAAIPGGTDPAAATVQVDNTGGGTLSGLSVGTITYGPGGSGWISSATLDLTTAPATLTVQAKVGALAGGTYTATIPVAAASAVNTPQPVSVTFTVTNQASIQLSRTTASSIAPHLGANPASTVVNITNGAGGTLTALSASVSYGAGASGWLGLSLSSTAAPATLTLTPVTGTVPIGTFTATVAVASPVAVNTPRTIAVTFQVQTSFANDVQPIFTANCTGCHFSGGNIPVLTAGSSYTAIRGVDPGVGCGPYVAIGLNTSGSSWLYNKVVAATPCGGGSQMPPGGPFLSIPTSDIIKNWIDEGSPNN